MNSRMPRCLAIKTQGQTKGIDSPRYLARSRLLEDSLTAGGGT